MNRDRILEIAERLVLMSYDDLMKLPDTGLRGIVDDLRQAVEPEVHVWLSWHAGVWMYTCVEGGKFLKYDCGLAPGSWIHGVYTGLKKVLTYLTGADRPVTIHIPDHILAKHLSIRLTAGIPSYKWKDVVQMIDELSATIVIEA